MTTATPLQIALIAAAAYFGGNVMRETFSSPADSSTERLIWGFGGALGVAYVISRIK